MKLKEYINKKGYRIQATDKAYHLFYEKQGFQPVEEEYVMDPVEDTEPETVPGEETEPEGSGDRFSGMKVADLKEYLDGLGIAYSSGAKKEELLEIARTAEAEGSGETGDAGGESTGESANAEDTGNAEV